MTNTNSFDSPLIQKLNNLEARIDKLETQNKTSTQEVEESITTNAKYQTNFISTDYGNGMKTGTELIVKIRDAETVTGKIIYQGNIIMIDQSHANDEDKDQSTINFKLKHRKYRLFNYDLPVGEYELHVWFYNKNTGETGSYRDKFQIIS